jgi:hypothetical protein
MHKLTRILNDSAPDVDDASGIQSRIRVFLPPEATTFATVALAVEEEFAISGEHRRHPMQQTFAA